MTNDKFDGPVWIGPPPLGENADLVKRLSAWHFNDGLVRAKHLLEEAAGALVMAEGKIARLSDALAKTQEPK